MKNGLASENKNIYLKSNVFILTDFINQTTTCYSGQRCHYKETSPLIYRTNQWDGFYTMAKLDWNKLNFFLMLNTNFSIYIFPFREESLLPFPWVFNLTIYFTKTRNTKNANWKFTKQ